MVLLPRPEMAPIMPDPEPLGLLMDSFAAKSGPWCGSREARLFSFAVEFGPPLKRVKSKEFLVFGGAGIPTWPPEIPGSILATRPSLSTLYSLQCRQFTHLTLFIYTNALGIQSRPSHLTLTPIIL